MISTVEPSTLTLNAEPAPATEELSSTPVIPADDTFTPSAPTVNVEPSASTATDAAPEPSKVKSAIPLPSVTELPNTTPVMSAPDPLNEPEKAVADTVPKPAKSVTVAPKSTFVVPKIDPEFTRATFGISLKFASTT